jgi:NADH:ubiquinone oxidoreductase subunit H
MVNHRITKTFQFFFKEKIKQRPNSRLAFIARIYFVFALLLIILLVIGAGRCVNVLEEVWSVVGDKFSN